MKSMYLKQLNSGGYEVILVTLGVVGLGLKVTLCPFSPLLFRIYLKIFIRNSPCARNFYEHYIGNNLVLL